MYFNQSSFFNHDVALPNAKSNTKSDHFKVSVFYRSFVLFYLSIKKCKNVNYFLFYFYVYQSSLRQVKEHY